MYWMEYKVSLETTNNKMYLMEYKLLLKTVNNKIYLVENEVVLKLIKNKIYQIENMLLLKTINNKIYVQVKQKELTKPFMTISYWKNPLVSMVYTKIFQRFKLKTSNNKTYLMENKALLKTINIKMTLCPLSR